MLAGGTSRSGRGEAPGAAPGRHRPVESWTVTAADVDAWLERARQGDVLVYAHGPSLIQGAAAARIRRLIEGGEVIPLGQRRCADGGFDYRVARHRAKAAQRAPLIDPNMMAVLVELQDAAQNHLRCPSDAELGQATGLSADQVKWQLKKLQSAGMIAKRIAACRTDPKFRVVKVVATGAETAGPEASLRSGPSTPTGAGR